MVKEVIVLGHHISQKVIKVDRAKIDVIKRLPSPISLKVIRIFLLDVGFYQRFIKISQKLYTLFANCSKKNVMPSRDWKSQA